MRDAIASSSSSAASGDASTTSMVLAKAGEDSAAAVAIDPLPMCQFTVPHKPTSPGEYLLLCGSVPELGRWVSEAARSGPGARC